MLQWFRKQEMDPKAGKNNGDLHIALTRKVVDFLASQISSPKKASSILAQVARFKELPPNYQEKELPSLYLKLEQYFVLRISRLNDGVATFQGSLFARLL